MELLSVDTAVKNILSRFSALDLEIINIRHLNGRILGKDFVAIYDLPYFDNSTMDGFVLRAEDTLDVPETGSKRLRIVGDIKAGDKVELQISKNQAARIVTGGIIPAGGNAVIPVEDTNIKRWEAGAIPPSSVIINKTINKGDNIRYQGQFFKKGDILLEMGLELKPQHIGIIASQGIIDIEVYKRPRVGLFSTGDEVLDIKSELEFGKVYDTNSMTLAAFIKSSKSEYVHLESRKDNIDNIRDALDQLCDENVDLIISSAGVSAGAHDFVRYVIEKEGVLNFWRVNMRPGKPLVYGSYKNVPFIGLPGNPVSAYIGFLIFVKPILQKLMGGKTHDKHELRVRLLDGIESDGRESYLRAKIFQKQGEWMGKPIHDQDSGNLYSLVEANGIIIIPQGEKNLPKNSVVKGYFLEDI